MLTDPERQITCLFCCRLQIDQSNSEIGLLFPPQMGWCVDQHHLERRANRACEKMIATRRAVGQPEDDVDVKTGLALVSVRYVPDRAQYLALLSDLNLFVVFFSKSNHPTVAFSKAPMAVSEAAVSWELFANFVSAANASFRPRFVGHAGLL